MEYNYSIKLLNDEARFLHGKDTERLLAVADIDKLKENIHGFKKMDIMNMTDIELEKHIDDVLSIKLESGIRIVTTMFEYSIYNKGSRFYRVRKLDNADMPNRKLKKVSAYWNPPQKYVTNYGRLNKPKESLLYTALNSYTAMCETNIQSGDPFVLCVYEAKKPLRFSWIGGKANYTFNHIQSKQAIEYLETVRQFLVYEFTRVVPEGHEHLYRITEMIAKKYYMTSNEIGWRYPSIKNGFEDNICFNSKMVMDNIKLVGALTAIRNEENEENPKLSTMSVKHVILGPNMDDYYPYDSEKGEECMERLFPEFRKAKD